MLHISQKTVTSTYIEISTPLIPGIRGDLAIPVGHVRDLIHAAATVAEEQGIDPLHDDAFLLHVTDEDLVARIPQAAG